MRHDELLISPDSGAPSIDRSTACYQLQALRSLLERDYLARPDWHLALRDILEMVRCSLGQVSSMLAFWDPDTSTWSAVTGEGREVPEDQISSVGSRSVLEWVRVHDAPLLALEDERLQLAPSVRALLIGGIIAVPFYWLEDSSGLPLRRFAGCLHTHRTGARAPFLPTDVQLLVDITHIIQPVLNLLFQFRKLKEKLELERTLREHLQLARATEYSLGGFRTRDPDIHRTVLDPLQRACTAHRLNVLLLGPTGSGKTHLAEAAHYAGTRRGGPFVVLDCSQVTSAETLGAELFGYSADSGYHNSPRQGRQGKARLAHQGTLFIDEIGCLPLELQQRLLRLIERGTFSPLGTGAEITIDVQVISATNEDLDALVREGRFREDLYWRLSELVVRLPSLNERAVDIPDLAAVFLGRACQRTERPELQSFSADARHRLLTHDWGACGNIRGLEQTMLRSVLLAPPGASVLQSEDIRLPNPARRPAPVPVAPVAPVASASLSGIPVEIGEDATTGLVLEQIKQAIRQHGYATTAARSLGMTHRQLTWQLQRAGLRVRDVLARMD